MIAGLRRRLAGGAEIDWRDPLRMSIAALLAYGAATALHLPEAFWAVLSALVVSRPHRGGTMQAGVGRFAGTLAGVVWAMAVAAGRHWLIEDRQIAEVWLLLALLLPLTVLVTWRADWRTAPIAAVIALSSAPHGNAPLAAAALRLAEITLGAGIGMAVAWLLLPAGSLQRAENLTARLLDALAGLLDGEDAQHTIASQRPMDASRRLLQHLTAASRAAPWEGSDHARAEQLAGLAARLHGDVGFLRRCLATKAAIAVEKQRIEVCRMALRGIALRLRGRDAPLLSAPVTALPQTTAQTTATGELLAMLEQDIAALARLVTMAPQKKWRLPKQPPSRGEGREDKKVRLQQPAAAGAASQSDDVTSAVRPEAVGGRSPDGQSG